MRDLKDKVVLIIGGSRGLGFTLAQHLSKEGCRLVLCARNLKELQLAQQRLPGEVLIAVCDVALPEQVENLIQIVLKQFGQIDVLINDAGVMMVGAMESYSRREFEEAMDVMYWGIVNTTFAVLPHMKKQRRGQIVNITSIGGLVSVPHLLPYVSAKFAAVGFSLGCAAELRKDHIAVTTIVPGLMRTGSYVNAFFQQHNKKEFKLFALISTAPLITISADKAARLIVRAIKNKTPIKVLGLPAKVLLKLNDLFPTLMIRSFSAVSRFIPSKKERSTFVPGEDIREEYPDTEVPLFREIGKYVQRKHGQQVQ